MAEDILFEEAAKILVKASHVSVFTGAGISVESGIPPFRGEGGLWEKYDPSLFDLRRFMAQPGKTWALLKEVFYDFFGKSEPNLAHKALAELEKLGIVKAIITQNIDNLHQLAGSKEVIEFHGTSRDVVCLNCGQKFPYSAAIVSDSTPSCSECQGLLKPDFIFFGEGIPQIAMQKSIFESMTADVFLIIGTTGEVYPAAMIPAQAKQRGAKIIEVNPEPSSFTPQITDIFLRGKGEATMTKLLTIVKKSLQAS